MTGIKPGMTGSDSHRMRTRIAGGLLTAATLLLTGCGLSLPGADPAASQAAPQAMPSSANGLDVSLDAACDAYAAYQADKATYADSLSRFESMAGDIRAAIAADPDLAPLLDGLGAFGIDSSESTASLDDLTGVLGAAC